MGASDSAAAAFVNSGQSSRPRKPVRSFEEAGACDIERYGELFRHLLARGVYVPPSQFEAWMVSTSHGDAEVDRTVEAARSFVDAAH